MPFKATKESNAGATIFQSLGFAPLQFLVPAVVKRNHSARSPHGSTIPAFPVTCAQHTARLFQ